MIRRRHAVVSLVLPCLLTMPGVIFAFGQPRPASDAVAAGQAALARKDYGVAASTARSILERQPQSAGALYLLARALEGLRQPRLSLEWFTKAAAVAPPTGEDLRIVALDYVQLNDNADALRWLSRSVGRSPENAEAWYDLGRVRMTQGDMSGARAPLETSLRLSPHLAKAANNLGLVEEAEGHPRAAEQRFREAIAWQAGTVQPSEQPLLNLGSLLLSEQHGSQAVPLLEQATALSPGDPKCHEGLARAYDQQGRPKEAVVEMARAVELASSDAHLHFQLGQLYRRTGQADLARQELKRSRELYGEHSNELQP